MVTDIFDCLLGLNKPIGVDNIWKSKIRIVMIAKLKAFIIWCPARGLQIHTKVNNSVSVVKVWKNLKLKAYE